MKPKSVLPLRLAAVVLAILGVFPLAAIIKYAPIVQWLPRATLEWAVGVPVVLALAAMIAGLPNGRADRLIERARATLLPPTPVEFRSWTAFVTLSLSLFFAWYCYGGHPMAGDEMSQRFQA